MKINNTAELKSAIRQLKHDEKVSKDKLVDQFHSTVERLKPINLIKNFLGFKIKPSSAHEESGPSAENNKLSTAAGFGVGLLSKIFLGKSTGLLKRILLTATELGAVNLLSKNSSSLKLWGLNLLSKIFKPKKS